MPDAKPYGVTETHVSTTDTATATAVPLSFDASRACEAGPGVVPLCVLSVPLCAFALKLLGGFKANP